MRGWWLVLILVASHAEAARLSGPAQKGCGTTRGGGADSLWSHRERMERRGPVALAVADGDAFDVGQIAVLRDRGDLALLRNPLDLQNAALRFTPGQDGYTVSRLALPLEPDAGTPVRLGDDASTPVALGFSFPFFGRNYTDAFLNSDGNLTFGQKDDASTERSLGRLVDGAPRIAPLFSDLDPSDSGTVSTFATSDHFTVSWRAVPRFGETDRNTFQMVLWIDGRIDFVYAEVTADVEGVVGVAPGGGRNGLTAVDMSNAAALTGAGALAESFRGENQIDTVAVSRRFFATHPDQYQQLVVFSSETLVEENVIAYQITVKQTETGTGGDRMDLTAAYGSRGTLESFVMMDELAKYPDDLNQAFVGEDSTLAVLAHETGHRWLASARFRDGRDTSSELLGRDGVHWSFFFDTDGSFLEGNDIEPRGNAFRTVGSSLRYSALDQYLMGLRTEREVPPFFFVRPSGTTSTTADRAPRTGVTINGTRKDVTIQDVIAAIGPRQPAGAPWTVPFRQAYVYVAVGDDPAEAAALQKIDRIRAAFPPYFLAATEGRGAVDTRLD